MLEAKKFVVLIALAMAGACADRLNEPEGDLRYRCTHVTSYVTDESGESLRLPLNDGRFDPVCTCTSVEEIDAEYRDYINDLGYEHCLEMVEGYEENDCDERFEIGMFGDMYGFAPTGLTDEPPPCDESLRDAGCG